VLLSGGLCNESERQTAFEIFRDNELMTMRCVTAYPCEPFLIGFREGLSDHSGSIYPGLRAAVLGAPVIEVHLILARGMGLLDEDASLTPDQLRQLVEGVRYIENMKPQEKPSEEMRRLFMTRDEQGRKIAA
jgi:N-acetylneuraminate synthase